MIDTKQATLANATLNTIDIENQSASKPNQNSERGIGRNLRKGALALICAATAGATLRELATQHIHNPPNIHPARILMPDTGNTTCPEGTYRFDKASQLKRAKIGAGIGIGLIPGLAIAGMGASVLFLKLDQEIAATSALFLGIGCGVGSLASIPITASMLAAAKTTKDGTCIKKNNNPDNSGGRG